MNLLRNRGCTAATTSGLERCVGEEMESVFQPRFHNDTVWKVHSVPILNIYSILKNWRAVYHNQKFYWTDGDFACRHAQRIQLESLYITTENFTGLDGGFWSRFCPFFMLRPLEKFTMCQYIYCYHKKRLQTIKKENQLHQSSQHFPYIFDYY